MKMVITTRLGDMMKLRQPTGLHRVMGVITPVVALIVVLGVASPVGASTAKSVAVRIAQYAVATADHDNPAHAVTAADVTNAAGIDTLNTSNLFVLINLDDVSGYPRLVLFFDQKPFSDICLNLPDTIGGAPTIIKCPHQAQGLWDSRAGALLVSNRAIAAAALAGKAVSGADVVSAAKLFGLTLRRKPTFRAGQGGTVEFTTTAEMAPNTKVTVNNCVRLPKTPYGIPVEVPC
jgi:hypothetical protein